MAERLQTQVRRETELLADVSHARRTPMARIRVALELAAEAERVPSRRYLEEIGEELGDLDRGAAGGRLDCLTRAWREVGGLGVPARHATARARSTGGLPNLLPVRP